MPIVLSPSFSVLTRRTSTRHERVELEGPAARRRFGAAEHHADLLADLVDEDHRGARFGDGPGELPHGLAHHAGLQADVRIADFAIELRLGHEGRHRVDHDDVDRVGFDQHLGDLQALFPVGRLADEQVFEIDAQPLGPGGIERMLGVDEGGDPPFVLGAGDRVQGQRRLAARLRSKQLDHPAPGKPAPPKAKIERQGAGGNALDAKAAVSSVSFMIEPLPKVFSI